MGGEEFPGKLMTKDSLFYLDLLNFHVTRTFNLIQKKKKTRKILALKNEITQETGELVKR